MIPCFHTFQKPVKLSRICRWLRRRPAQATIPGPGSQRANRHRRGSKGGRPVGFDKTTYKRRKRSRANGQRAEELLGLAMRFDRRAYILHGTGTVPSVRLWLKP
jgi:hypothetical protein